VTRSYLGLVQKIGSRRLAFGQGQIFPGDTLPFDSDSGFVTCLISRTPKKSEG